jgi:O-methyltransferase
MSQIEPSRLSDPAAQLYLDLLKRAVSHSLYEPMDVGLFGPGNPLTAAIRRLLERRGYILLRDRSDAGDLRAEGRDWPAFAQTMIGRERLDNIQRCATRVLADGIPGDLIEAGVWRGGAAILMRGVLAAYGVTDRAVWLADSFEGLPPPEADRYPADEGARWHAARALSVPLDEVKRHFERYGLLDDQVRFAVGWFAEALPEIPDPQWALIRLDGDMYGSTFEALSTLYPNLSVGGYVIVDDYVFPQVAEAVVDYRRANGIGEELERVDWNAVQWCRES